MLGADEIHSKDMFHNFLLCAKMFVKNFPMHTSQREESFLRGQKRDRFETFFQL